MKPVLMARVSSLMPSTAIRNMSYDERTSRLDVRFVSGEVYSYYDVPAAVASDFAKAGSKGGYFQRNIRDRFAFRRDRSGTLM